MDEMKWYEVLKEKFIKILEDRKTRLAMVIVPAITIILLFILSGFWGKFAAVLLTLSLVYWIFDRAR